MQKEKIPKSRATFVLIGGFLGAGKSSVIRSLTERAKASGITCGLVTNDQGEGLVDSAMAAKTGASVQEIPGGCFCCRADALVEAIAALEKTARPELFLAEPVGSCTDLVATVLRPIQEVYRLPLRVAPMVVVVDALRFRDEFCGRKKKTKGFSKGVRYIWDKQLEEAEVILLNKADGLAEGDAVQLIARLADMWPKKTTLLASARTGLGMEGLFQLITQQEAQAQPTMAVDYALYGAGEAELGWLNATVDLEGVQPFDADAYLLNLAAALQGKVEVADGEVAHLKISLTSAELPGALGVVQGVRNGVAPEATTFLKSKICGGQISLNLRAEAAPELLEHAFHAALKETLPLRTNVDIHQLQAFRPG